MNKLELKSALRNLRKKRVFSIVNIGGLTLGLLCALFIGTYTLHQFSFDRHYPDADRLYRVIKERDKDGYQDMNVLEPTGLKYEIDKGMPQVESAVRLQWAGGQVFGNGQEFIKEERGFYAEQGFLQLFGIKMLEGNAETALQNPMGILLSKSYKQKYFGDQSALGETLELGSMYGSGMEQFEVVGVFEDLPANMHLKSNYFLSFEKIRLRASRPVDAEWNNSNAFTYLKLSQEAVPEFIAMAMTELAKTKADYYEEYGISFQLQPVASIHLQDFTAFGDIPGQVKRSSLYILIGIGTLILVLVCINFFNLSMARSLERAREVGVRKSVGASRFQLIRLYLVESSLQVFSGLVLAVILFEIAGNFFSGFLGIPVSMTQMTENLGISTFIGLAFSLCFVLILGAGLYPSLLLSRFKLVESLKGKVKIKSGRFSLRQCLMVIQFVITLVIGVVASVIYNQVAFMETNDPGYNRQQMLSVSVFNSEKMKLFGESLRTNSHVSSVTFGDDDIWGVFNSGMGYTWEGKAEDEDHRVWRMSVDNNFIDVMELKLLDGRSFDARLKSDSSSVILNETAAKLMNIESVANFPTIKKGEELLNVIGIVKDFQSGDFRQERKPMVFNRNPHRFYNVYIQLSSENTGEALSSIEETWKGIMPQKPFDYRFLDEAYEALLAKDRITSQVLLFFTGLSIVISFIGLFGMLRLRVQNRMQEMGIRKILGASFAQILKVVSKEFVMYLMLAVLAGIPIAIVLGRNWLNEFSQRISISFNLPLVVVLCMFFLAGFTLLLSAFPLNRLNLVETLKDD